MTPDPASNLPSPTPRHRLAVRFAGVLVVLLVALWILGWFWSREPKVPAAAPAAPQAIIDRKSTRLNSSH